ncbi:TPA: hypothetical protein ACGBIO_000736 [Providencia rettgeri]
MPLNVNNEISILSNSKIKNINPLQNNTSSFISHLHNVESSQNPFDLLSTSQQKIAINQERDELKNNIQHDIKKAAIYGISKHQLECADYMRAVNKEVQTIMIGSLNQSIGLNKVNVYPLCSVYGELDEQLNAFVNALENRSTVDADWVLKSYLPFVNQWQVTLANNKHKIDIFQYLAKKSNTQEQLKELKKLIIKNTSPKTNSDELYNFIKNKILPCQSLSEFRAKLQDLYQTNKEDINWNSSGLFNLIENHFFRNTSKIGLNFFLQHHHSIILTWNQNDEKGFLLSDINQKNFKHGFRRLYNNKECIEPITFSEIRHLERNKSQFSNNIIRILLHNDSAMISKGFDDKWFEYKDSEMIEQ